MAKKARKTNRPNVSKDALERARKEMYAVPAEAEEVVDAPAAAKVGSAVAAARAPRKGVVLVPRVVNLREEYAYVLQDLRNMAILASGLMIVLLLMALFIIK